MSTQTARFQETLAPATTAEAQPRATHLLYIDNLRTTLITFVITLHLAITYGADGLWYYKEPGQASTVMFVSMMFIAAIGSAFSMGLFLLLAGYFTTPSYDRKGFTPFLADRLKWLLIPLAFYQLIINPLLNYLVDLHKKPQPPVWEYLAYYFRNFDSFGDGPVWFLVTLIFFSLAYALWRRMTGSASTSAGKPLPVSLPGNWAIALFAIALGLTTFIDRLWFSVGIFYEPWHQEFAHYPQYIAMFALGTLAYRQDWLTRFSNAQVRVWKWVALACVLTLPAIVIAAGVLTGQLDERGAGGWNWISFSYSIWEGFTCLAFSIIILAWYRQRFDRQGWLAAKMADATFTAYVIHPAIIVPLAIILSPIFLNLDLKFLLVAPLGVALTYFISYHFRRLPLIRNVF
jgi:glucans biosynthesis protein C